MVPPGPLLLPQSRALTDYFMVHCSSLLTGFSGLSPTLSLLGSNVTTLFSPLTLSCLGHYDASDPQPTMIKAFFSLFSGIVLVALDFCTSLLCETVGLPS